MQGMFRKVAAAAAIAAAGATALYFFYGPFAASLARAFPDSVPLARVLAVSEEIYGDSPAPYWVQTVRVRLLADGTETAVHTKGLVGSDPGQKMAAGDTVVLAKNAGFEGGDAYFIADRYRLPALAGIALAFFVLVLVFGGWRGLSSFFGLAASVAVLLAYVVPALLAGHDALLVAGSGAALIAVVSLYCGHGFNARTTVAVLGTLITLAAGIAVAGLFVQAAALMGLSSDESFYLNVHAGALSLRGLLLAGIIIGMTGVLDDVTMGQAATVYELHKADPRFGFRELFRRGTAVGREHIASLVNTLVLAYAGASLPVFLYFVLQSRQVPWFVIMNGEIVAEEIVRTLAGSVALVLAVPVTTALAAYWYGVRKGR